MNAILDCNFRQTIEKLILKVADGGHFGFLSPTIFPYTFGRGTLYLITFIEDKKSQMNQLSDIFVN